MEMSESMQQLAAIAEFVFVELKARNLQGSCIRGSAIMLKVLDTLGYDDAIPLAVNVTICNDKYLKWRETNGEPQDQAGWESFNKNECIYAVVGKKAKLSDVIPEDKWPGHLVVVVPRGAGDRHVVLDLTIVQMERADIGLFVKPSFFWAEDSFLRGEEPKVFKRGDLGFRYDGYPDDKSYCAEGQDLMHKGVEADAEQILARMIMTGFLRKCGG